MSDRQIESQTSPSTQTQSEYATQPNGFRPGFSATTPQPQLSGHVNQSAGNSLLKPAVLIVALAIMASMLVYQQNQIGRLNKELGLVNDNLKNSDVHDRLDAQETKLQELNNRLTYLDSKVSATDEKAQIALNKLKIQEDNDFFGNAIKAIKHTFGIQ